LIVILSVRCDSLCPLCPKIVAKKVTKPTKDTQSPQRVYKYIKIMGALAVTPLVSIIFAVK
jgi:hypothetical protein